MAKVVVAMSGGVDSSVAAALLKKQGHEVIGMMLRLWTEPGREAANRCCTPAAMELAKQVATALDIPFYVVDAKDTFSDQVVAHFIEGYKRGITPNPCVVCNRHIRWEFLLNRALAMGADFMATGHYARLERTQSGQTRLFEAKDPVKDQSYVLYGLDPSQLAHALFPIGEYSKEEVRQLAAQFGLPVSRVKDSQDLCFLAGTTYTDFLSRNVPDIAKSGPIISSDGTILGEHSGVAFYTIGQRKRLGISSPEPIYVIRKDVSSNTLIVGPKELLGKHALTAGGVNWLNRPLEESFLAEVKTRYTAPKLPASVHQLSLHSISIEFSKPVRDVTPGQAAVMYISGEVVGGAIIEEEALRAQSLRPVSLLGQP